MRLLAWTVIFALAAPIAWAEPARPTLGPMGDRDIVITNRSKTSAVEIYVSPQSADSWGQDLLGDDVLDPKRTTRLKLGRSRDCIFDVLVVYDDTSREEKRGANLCKSRELVFDGSTASAPVEPPGPQRSVTIANASHLPIQQLFLSPPDAAQWGDDRLTQSTLSVGEERAIPFRGDCNADIRVVFANRAAEERRGLDLCTTTRLAITPGWTTADRP